jgi:hypothetical protein
MIGFGKRLFALFFAALSFAVYYMFLYIIIFSDSSYPLDNDDVEMLFVLSFLYSSCGFLLTGWRSLM